MTDWHRASASRDDPLAPFANLARLLAPGGRFAFAV
jgi:hypothetical protein